MQQTQQLLPPPPLYSKPFIFFFAFLAYFFTFTSHTIRQIAFDRNHIWKSSRSSSISHQPASMHCTVPSLRLHWWLHVLHHHHHHHHHWCDMTAVNAADAEEVAVWQTHTHRHRSWRSNSHTAGKLPVVTAKSVKSCCFLCSHDEKEKSVWLPANIRFRLISFQC